MCQVILLGFNYIVFMFMQESNPALALAGRIESVLCAPSVPPTSEITPRALRCSPYIATISII
jgi:hypothetical protein